jgi:hypothetical protein
LELWSSNGFDQIDKALSEITRMMSAKGGFAMQMGRKEYRGVLVDLEGITAKKAVN